MIKSDALKLILVPKTEGYSIYPKTEFIRDESYRIYDGNPKSQQKIKDFLNSSPVRLENDFEYNKLISDRKRKLV